MNWLYNLGIATYRSLIAVAATRNAKAKKMIEGRRNLLQEMQQRLDPAGGYIWIHASSFGEFEQGRPIIEMIKERNPEARIVLTFFSPSGYEVCKNYNNVDGVFYLPFDTPCNVRKFLDIVKPSMAIFVKYEFWGNYLQELKRRNIPTYIVSSIFRPSQMFFKPWGGMFRSMLGCFNTIFVQNEESQKLLASIGVKNVVVAGDTRFDRVLKVKQSTREFPLIAKFVEGHDFTLVMGSSWQPDEDIAIPYFNSHSDMRLIIAPHEFSTERLKALVEKIERKTLLYSQATPDNIADAECLIIDCFGILSSLYRYGQAAYIGGGFGAGIHNINEAAVYNIPVIFGPNNRKFREAQDLKKCGGGFEITDAQQFSEVVDSLTGDRDNLLNRGAIAGKYINSQLGATEKIINSILK